jgi:hypothetical protein
VKGYSHGRVLSSAARMSDAAFATRSSLLSATIGMQNPPAAMMVKHSDQADPA